MPLSLSGEHKAHAHSWPRLNAVGAAGAAGAAAAAAAAAALAAMRLVLTRHGFEKHAEELSARGAEWAAGLRAHDTTRAAAAAP